LFNLVATFVTRQRGSREGEGVAEASFEGEMREGCWSGRLETNDDAEMTERRCLRRWN
jgi:hypothetical protein